MAVVYSRYLFPDVMKELQVFESEKQMLEELSKEPYAFNPHINKSKSINDDRIGWAKTYYVMNKIDNEEFVYGMCDTETYKNMSVEEARENTLNTYKEWM